MLVLSRKLNEKLLFPGIGAAVRVVSIKPGVVRLGIEAPPGVAVLREELAGPAAPPAPAPDAFLRERLRHLCAGLAELHGRLGAALPPAAADLGRLEAELRALRGLVGATAEPPPRPPRGPGRGRRALLVEDNANERELLAQLLRLGGFEVDTAGDGADALDYLRARGKPDVLLLDMGLPRLDGPTTVREIRRDSGLAGLKIVAVSGHGPEEYNLTPGPGGIDRWFTKPVDPTLLIRHLEGELDQAMSS